MKGRKPTPKAVLKLRGSKRLRDRADEPEAPVPDELPEPPEWFSDTARTKWAELLPILRGMRVLTVADMDHVQVYCVAYSRWVKAESRLAEMGEVVTHKNGVDGLNHWLKIAQMAMERMDRSGAELGLSPTARARLHVRTPEHNTSDRRAQGKERFFA